MDTNQDQTTQPMNTPEPMPTPGNGNNDVENNKVMAALAYVWILSIIFLLAKKDSPFIQFHAKQGTVLFVASFILGFIPIIGWLLNIAVLVLAIMGIVNAYKGKWTKLPVVSTVAEQIKF